MKLVDHLTRSGERLFSSRSYLPFLLAPAFVASFVGFRYPFDSHGLDLAWEVGCFQVSATGLAIRVLFLPIIVSLAALLYYERIAAREEEYLEGKFGGQFREWAARVPAILPTGRGHRPPATPFSWRKALSREF